MSTTQECKSAVRNITSPASEPVSGTKGVLTKSPGILRKACSVLRKAAAFWTRNVLEGIVLRRQAERFYLVFGGHIFFQTLRTACKFDLFTMLARNGAMTIEDITERLRIERQPARILLLGLTATKLLRKTGNKYRCTRLSQQLLSQDSPKNVLPYIELQHHGMYKAMPHFHDAVVENRNVGLEEFRGNEPTFYERLVHEPELEQIFQDAMSALSVQANELLAEYIDLSGVHHLIDVGGGDGTNIISLARRFPNLRATVFDLPSVCEIARKNIAASGMSDRLDVFAGNCFVDSFPDDADCVLFSHFFTIWSEAKDRLLLAKAHDVLRTGGRVILFNMMQDDDESGPLSAAVGSPYFLTLATGEGMLYTWSEYECWMKESGFANVMRHVLPRDHGIVTGAKL